MNQDQLLLEMKDRVRDGVASTALNLADSEISNPYPIAAITAGLTYGGSRALTRLLGKKMNLFRSGLSLAMGASVPFAHNKLVAIKKSGGGIREARGAMPSLSGADSIDLKLMRSADNVKTAGLSGSTVSSIGKIIGTAGKSVGAVASGILPTRNNAKLGEKIVGYTAKGAAGAGIIYGARKYINDKNKSTSPKKSYTRYLRNNLMAGHINQNEVNKLDIEAVRKLGMK